LAEQQKGIVPRGNVANVATLANDLAAFEPASEEQKISHRETYDRFNELVERRRSRLLGVTAGLSGALWALVYLGAVINIAVTWCFQLHNQRMHLWMTALTSALLGADDLPPLSNGSSVFREVIGVSGTFSAYLR
jgi:hypothetical protein